MSPVRNDIEEICRVFRENDRFLIACHENPEGDAIGSELALALALRKMGKTATVLNADPVPGNLAFLPGAGTVVAEEDGSRYQVAVVVDCGSPERTGRVGSELLKCPVMVNIDHHRTNGAHGDFCLIEPEAAATGLSCGNTDGVALTVGYSSVTSPTPPLPASFANGNPVTGTRWLRWTAFYAGVETTGCACFRVLVN